MGNMDSEPNGKNSYAEGRSKFITAMKK